MYTIKKISSDKLNKDIWSDIPSLQINLFPWDTSGYKPETSVQLIYTDTDLHVRFTSCEKKVRIESEPLNGNTFQDSCVEFFFMPCKESGDMRYFNFEMNAAGALLLQLDDKVRERPFVEDVDPSIFDIKTDVNKDNVGDFDNFKPWTVEYKIPLSFINKYFADFKIKSGDKLWCNFYKCGDKTETAHYGTAFPIEYHKPSFHRPEFFGTITFE